MNKKLIIIAVLAALLLLSPLIQAYEIEPFLTQENHFLRENDAIEQPTVTIEHNDSDYWVVPVLSGESLSTFIPLYVDRKEVSKAKTVNRALFKTAFVLRSYILNKTSVSTTPGAKWFVTSSNSGKIKNLARFLSDEMFEISIIEASLKDAGVDYSVSGLKPMLNSMSLRSVSLSQEIDEALEAERSLTGEPATAELDDFKQAFEEVFLTAYALEDEALEYKSEITKLKNIISIADLDADEKFALGNRATPPEEFNFIGGWASEARALEEIVDSVYENAGNRAEGLLEELNTRISMSAAWKELYAEDQELEDLDQSFDSLAVAVSLILHPDNRQFWSDQQRVTKLDSDWDNAVDFYASADYVLSIEYADKAKRDVKAIHDGGFRDLGSEPLLSQELLIQLVIVLIALLAIIIVIRKRDGIMAFFRPSEEEERVEVHGWE